MTETSRRRGRIDVQVHFSPAFYTDRVDEAGGHVTTDRWSVDAALDYMDTYGIATGMLSVSTPGVDFLEPAESVTMARRQ